MNAGAKQAAEAGGLLARVLREEGWVRRVLTCVVMSCIVATATEFVQKRFQATIDAVAQGYALARLQPQPQRCDAQREICVSLLSIDEEEYRSVFGQRSPLDPVKLTEFLSLLATAPPKVLAIDLDLAPASEEDWLSRRPLLEVLHGLSERMKLVMVCPQGYSLRNPSELDRQWTRSFVGKDVRFAHAELDAEGLYYEAAGSPLGQVAADAAQPSRQAEAGGTSSASTDWDAWCARAPSAASAQRAEADDKPKKIRPSALPVVGYSDVGKNPELLRDQVVVFGGQYGTADRFFLPGAVDGVYGMTLHGWVAAGELNPEHEVPKSAELALDVMIGLAAGALFHLIWKTMRHHRKSFFWRGLMHIAFLGVAVGLPALLLGLAVAGALSGLLAGAAGMIISVTADSVFSSQEALAEEDDDAKAHHSKGAANQPAGNAKLVASAATFARLVLGMLTVAALMFLGESAIWSAVLGFLAALALWVVNRKQQLSTPASENTTATPASEGAITEAYVPTRSDQIAHGAWLAAQAGFVVWVFHRPENWSALALVIAFLAALALLDQFVDQRRAVEPSSSASPSH